MPPPPPSATAARATLAAEPPLLDGRDEDAVWRSAPAIDQFLQAKPSEGAPARFKTEARFAYDARNLYVFVRAFDPQPDSIVGQLARRDEQPPSDEIIVLLDSYHDRRTGYEFVVNPAGVKADYAIYNDGDEDVAWDAVWEAATQIDSLGWTAEYQIPLSQLRYAGKGNVTFGILIWRTIQRHTETVTWPLYRTSRSGFTSQFGELNGLEGLASPGHAEITPYLLTKNVTGPAVGRLRAGPGGQRRWRPQVPGRVEPAAQRHGQPRLRTGGGRPLGAQPGCVRDLLRGAAAVLRGGEGALHVHRELRRRGGLRHRRGPVLLPPDRPLAAARRDVRRRFVAHRDPDPRRRRR